MAKDVKCCATCFGDSFLVEHIAANPHEVGKCSYCEAENAALVSASELSDWFELVTSIYAPDENGRTLVEWLKSDWDLFHHARMDIYRAKDLLAHVLDDFDIVQKTFSPLPAYAIDGGEQWVQLREELMYNNRYFPKFKLDESTLRKDRLGQLLKSNIPEIWYRARLQNSDKPFELHEMGPPPSRQSSHGRANPAGIPYLYLGSTPLTASSEVRPHTGETACIAEFKVKAGLQIVDLRNPRRDASPFNLETTEQVGQFRINISLLERLGVELTTPILPQGASIDYVPSQYLCEFIKNSGFDGVIYNSSVSDGMNLALFSPKHAEGVKVHQYKIERVDVTVREIT